jgi:pimeloyl-ACP methyl ester carboxylesterase
MPSSSDAAHAAEGLPPALSGERVEIDSIAGRLSYYFAAPEHRTAATDATPLLLVHSINASGSAYEVRPLYEHYRQSRPVYALDLPGFGFSERTDRPYLPRLMTDAVHAMTDAIRRAHDGVPVDVMAVSLSSEYVARAAHEVPSFYRSVALVSPTGFDRRAPYNAPPGSTRGIEWLRRGLSNPRWSDGVFRLLTRPSVIRFFLKKTWGDAAIDEGLFDYDLITSQQSGAKHAPLWFVGAFLFSADITRVYQSLTMPVWMVHGVRGDFVDYRHKAAYAHLPHWTFDVMSTGAMPYFERPEEFMLLYDAFLQSCASGSPQMSLL